MNDKDNFGGDVDDIDEISEMIDDGSKFVYTSEEEDGKRGTVEEEHFNGGLGRGYGFIEEDVGEYSSVKKNVPNENRNVAYDHINLFSDEDADDDFIVEEDDKDQNEEVEEYKVYNIIEATRQIETDLQNLIQSSNK